MYTKPWDHIESKPSETMVRRDEDGAHIPFDDGNKDYQEYKLWLDEGNEPAEDDPPSSPDPSDEPLDINDLNDQVEDHEDRIIKLEQTLETQTEMFQQLQREVGAKNGDAPKAPDTTG
jgi:hypothetical protein